MKSAPSRAEFVAIVAMLSAGIAFSIDAMLPALPDLAEQFSPEDPNRAQLVVTSFVLGMGLGTLFTGPLSDAFGRKPVVIGGATLYIVSTIAAIWAQSLEALLFARLVQGIGSAGPRIAALAIVRDRHAGRAMAQIVSFVMIVFTVVPAVAPLLGAQLIRIGGWTAVFWAFALFALLSSAWYGIRLPETLAPENRRPFRVDALRLAIAEMMAHPVVRWSIVAQSFSYAVLFSMISTVQPVYDLFFQRAESFPLWFGAIALASSSASFLNAALVMRLGMRLLVTAMLYAQLVISGVMILALLSGVNGGMLFAVFVFWQTSVFFQAGLTLGNLNAMAMEPMGHIAGLAASVIGSLATVAAVVLTVPVSIFFNETPYPVAVGILLQTLGGVLAMRLLKRAEGA